MFDTVTYDITRNWHTPSLGEVAELLVFYDHVDLRIPVGRLYQLVPFDLVDMTFFQRLVDAGRLRITIDQLPLGEVALELGLISGPTGPMDATEAFDRFSQAYPQRIEPPLTLTLLDAMPADQKARWCDAWDAMISRCHVLGRGGEAEFHELLDTAQSKMALVAEPAFLEVALTAFGQLQGPKIAGMLAQARVGRVEAFGRTFNSIEAPGETGADLLEFLSQAELLLDTVGGADAVDSYTAPAADQWARAVVGASWARASIGQDVEAFRATVTGGSSVSTAIDTGARRFHELETLLQAREPFARAIRNRPPDTSLAQAYFEAVSNKSWINSGPGKVVRFGFFTGAGIVVGATLTPVAGAAVGLGLNALDNFVLDSLLKGNACRTFVEDSLKSFSA